MNYDEMWLPAEERTKFTGASSRRSDFYRFSSLRRSAPFFIFLFFY